MNRNRLQILLIDSNEDNYALIRDLLAEIKAIRSNLQWITTYEAALKAFALSEHDIYLVSYHLDEHNGIELLREVTKKVFPIPVILLVEQANCEVGPEAIQSGAMDYLIKEQIGESLLERSIHYTIERKQMAEALGEVHAKSEQLAAAQGDKYSNKALLNEIAERQRLEKQIKKSLKRRTRQVQTSTEIAQEIATSPSLDELFRQVVNRVQEQFGYYHAHVYTLEGNTLVMQEGTGEVGRKLKDAGHKIELEAKRSLVARAARSGQPVLIPDVSREPSWLPNKLLPETKSEVAVPIRLKSEVLGVLDVQNNTVGNLNQEDQILLMGLCGQIAVAINNRRLETKRSQAEEAQKKLINELDSFAHTVGHNLRDPLDLIIGYADFLKENTRLPEELQEYLNAIARNGRKMSNIIEELQLLSGVRKAEVELKPLNMARIVAEVQQRLAYLIEEYQAKIIVSEYWPDALGHVPWVEEVWANYLSNAIIYGGQPPYIQLGATDRSDGMVRFWVRDNGSGLTPKEQAQLFTQFTRLSQARVSGHGLGLSIVRRIVTKLGGEVAVESKVGQGSIFSFTLSRA